MNSIKFGIILIALNCFIIFGQTGFSRSKVEEVFKWKKIVFENLPRSENSWVGPYPYFAPENTNIVSMGYHSASRLMIVAFLRRRPGVPTALGAFCVDEYRYGSSPKFWGFPNYEISAFQPSDFQQNIAEGRKDLRQSSELFRIISIFHITIDDKCNRLFFVDNGQVDYYRNTTYVIQKPALVVYDLPLHGCASRNFPIIRRSVLPDKITTKGANGFMHVFLDYEAHSACDDLFLYITNTFFNYLVVYDYKKDQFWMFEHETFLPVEAESYMEFQTNLNYQMYMGIYSIVLGYRDENGDRMAYYTPYAGTGQYAVSTAILLDRRKTPANFKPNDFRIMGYRGIGHQSLKTVIDYTSGVMFYSEGQSNQIRCWNINKSLNPDNIGVVFESQKFDFGAQMFIDADGYLWFEYSMVPFIYQLDDPLDFTKVNNRFFRVKVSDAIKGTLCED